MARVALISVAFAFLLFIQLARSQSTCTNARSRLFSSISSGQCVTMDAVCRSPCRGIYSAFYQSCPNAGVVRIGGVSHSDVHTLYNILQSGVADH